MNRPFRADDIRPYTETVDMVRFLRATNRRPYGVTIHNNNCALKWARAKPFLNYSLLAVSYSLKTKRHPEGCLFML